MASTEKYDRQLRLCGRNGQKSLVESRILLLGASCTGSETLKNLVLPGCGCITIVWCTGLDLDLVLDCGSGKLALVDGVLGTQLQNVKWNTDLEWTDDVLKENVNKLNELVKGRKKTVAHYFRVSNFFFV